MTVSFIGGENRRKPPTCRKSLTNLSHNVVSSTPLDRNFCLLCAYIRYSMFYFLYLDVYFIFFDFTVAHGDRKYYYVKVVESIQFVCSGISGSCRDVSAVNIYRSTVI